MAKCDLAKERYWRRLIRQRNKTGETVASFCARKDVPVHQFYWWQRRLQTREQPSPPMRRNGKSAGDQSAGDQREQAEFPFVSVRLPVLSQVPIEVLHPGGCVVRVPAEFDPSLLRRILVTLDLSSESREN